MEEIDLAAVAALLEQGDNRLKGFRKETYDDSFEAYIEENHVVWAAFRRLFAKEEPLREEEASEVAACLVNKMQEMLEAQKNRRDKEERQLNTNLYLVSYFFPALLSCQEYPKKDGNAYKMADVICKRWNDAFRGHTIQYADFASIQGGFKQKLCYVTTAVCQGLHKGTDCKEIMLMKKYRDEYLLKQEDGEEVIKAYYDMAPTIVKRIARDKSPEEKYRYLWEHYLQFCIAMIEKERYQECKQTYMQMVEELQKDYFATKKEKVE